MNPPDEFPKGAGIPEPKDVVQVVMTEEQARDFERHYLNPRRRELAGPMLFGPDDAPSYIIGVKT